MAKESFLANNLCEELRSGTSLASPPELGLRRWAAKIRKAIKTLSTGHSLDDKKLPIAPICRPWDLEQGLLVVAEVVLASECLATDVTGERTFVCVRALVDQEVVGLGEVALAVLTDILFLGPVGRQEHWEKK